MGKRYVDAGARCPFYCSEEMGKLYCCGWQRQQWVHVAWQSDKEKREHKRLYCRGDWEKCPIARIERGK